MSMLQYPGSPLVEQHRRALLERADAHRLQGRARLGQAPSPPRPSARRQWLAALNRTVGVQIRPIRVDDAALLTDTFARLSAESRRRRFLGTKNVLTPTEVRYLIEVDHHDHEAVVAVSRSDGRGLGVARYIRDADDRGSAELAVTVIDAWQFQGIGTRLVRRLTDRAGAEGVTRFTALVLDDNVAAQRLLAHLPGRPVVVERYEDRVSYVVELANC